MPSPEELRGLQLLQSAIDKSALKEMAQHEHWFRGDLSHILFPDGQRRCYEAIHAYEESHPNDPGPAVMLCHRGLGKSFLLCLYGIERCLRYPNQTVRYGSPSESQTEEIVEPILRFLLDLCPKELRPEKKGNKHYFRNPRWNNPNAVSSLVLFGCRENAGAQRGKRSNLILLDEVREIENAEHVVTHTLGGHFVRQQRPLMILSSTSPQTESHYFWKARDAAEREGRYFFCPTTENKDFTEEDDAVLSKICGGKHTTAWKREALCEKVGDETLLAVPSFSRNKDKIVQEMVRPRFFYPFLFADLGFKDYTASLFSYIDYPQQKLVIEDELLENGKGTAELTALMRAKEEFYFKPTDTDRKGGHYDEMRRLADDTSRGLADFAALGFAFFQAKKGSGRWSKWVGLAAVETLCFEDRLRIHPRCKHLIHQMTDAIKNRKQTDLVKEIFKGDAIDPDEPIMGHADALWALAYGVDFVKGFWLMSPYPAVDPGPNHFQIPKKAIQRPTLSFEPLQGITFGKVQVQK